jgi:protease-4
MSSGTQPGGRPERAVRAEAAPEPPPRPPAPPRRHPLAKLLVALLILVVIGSLALNFLFLGFWSLSSFEPSATVQEQFFSHNRYGNKKVAVLSIEGLIYQTDGFVKRQIDHALKDAKAGNLQAIVLRVDSPGGTVAASDYLYHHLRKLREQTHIPIIVSMGGLAASGGYYVSMAAGDTPESIFAEPATWTGSIGVIIPHYDLSELLNEKLGVREDSITSKPLKGMGSLARPMTDQERAIFDSLVKDGYDRFREVVMQGRPEFRKDSSALEAVATGQVFTAQQAVDNGLVDRIGYIEDAIDRAIEVAGLDKNDVKVVKYQPEPTLLNVLIGSNMRQQQSFGPETLLEMSSPRAYYLCTWLPPIVQRP